MTVLHRTVSQAILTLCLVILSLGASVLLLSVNANAQTPVTGGADFRNAPQLPSGQYVDNIVTGDTAWYAIVYTNDTPYSFDVAFQDAPPERGIDLSVSFVAPTLTTVDGPAGLVTGSGVAYPAGHTNVWFLKVTLATNDQVGVEYPIILTIDGVQAMGTDYCSDIVGCTLDDEYASVNVALSEASEELERARAQETLASVQSQLENSRGFIDTSNTLLPAAEARLQRAEGLMAQLCAPSPLCDEFPSPGTKTPTGALILGLIVLSFGALRVFQKLTADPRPKVEPPRRVSTLDQAQANQRANANKKRKKR